MLAQGRVTVAGPGRNAVIASVAMNPRELLVASATGVSVRRVTQIATWQSWRESRVLLDNVPLSEAIAEMNRYSSIRLVAADERTARIRMSGSFNAGATQAFLEALAYGFGIDSRRQDAGTIVLRKNYRRENNSWQGSQNPTARILECSPETRAHKRTGRVAVLSRLLIGGLSVSGIAISGPVQA